MTQPTCTRLLAPLGATVLLFLAAPATDAALGTLAHPGTELRHATPPSAELIIWPVMKSERLASARDKPEAELNALDLQEVVDHYELAYLVHTRAYAGDIPVFRDIVVSARDATILEQWSMVQSVVGVGHSQYNGDVPINT